MVIFRYLFPTIIHLISIIHLILPSLGNITIAGAIGTGSHGSTIKHNSSISSQVIGVRIVDGKGNIQVISDTDDLKSFRIHLGLLGKFKERFPKENCM